MAKYKLLRGVHTFPNPEYKEGSNVPSHLMAKAGDAIELSDVQFRAFHDKFEPAESEASSVRDEDTEDLEEAKREAARTGQNVNPNK